MCKTKLLFPLKMCIFASTFPLKMCIKGGTFPHFLWNKITKEKRVLKRNNDREDLL